ncbi:hypothetical protein [Burkholderia sp. B21-005]|uniref:hypothetical protein n=1 Tax=Burkholderia sp. B21-005 TaxID=2890406 RepID=UPI001E431050|nr:hypothetical protein [Burkholderia sp. B21-005]UEP42168.1 hypothetical protein LMA02_04155 [Burkholderia sp. B21-005]
MVTLRLVGGTDVTGIARRRPRAKQPSKTSTKPNLTPIPVGAILAAQIEAHETEMVRSPRRRDPMKVMKAEAQTVLRSLTLPGEKRTLGEVVDAMSQHVRQKKLAGESEWSPSFTKFHRKLKTYGIFVSSPMLWRTPNEQLECEVLNENLFLQHYPQCTPYEPVLQNLSF